MQDAGCIESEVSSGWARGCYNNRERNHTGDTTMQLTDGSLLKIQAFVDGKWIDADDGSTFAVTNPATGEVDRRGRALRR